MKENIPQIDGLVPIVEAAKRLGIAKYTIYNWQEKEQINVIKIGKYSYIRLIDIETILNRREEKIAAVLAEPTMTINNNKIF